MNEQLLKTSGADFYPIGKNSEKPYGEGEGRHPPPALYVRGLRDTQFKTHTVRKSALRLAKISVWCQSGHNLDNILKKTKKFIKWITGRTVRKCVIFW